MEISIALQGGVAFFMLAPSFPVINGNPRKQDETSVELKESPLGPCQWQDSSCAAHRHAAITIKNQQGDCSGTRVNAPQKLGRGEIRGCTDGRGYFSTGTPSASLPIPIYSKLMEGIIRNLI